MFLIFGMWVPGIIKRMQIDLGDDWIIVDSFIVFLIFVLLTTLCHYLVLSISSRMVFAAGGLFHRLVLLS